MHHEVLEELKSRLRIEFANKPEMTMSEIRDILGTSRKYAVPICEYLDASKFTIRDSDVRRLNENSSANQTNELSEANAAGEDS